jgi:hypothetical protein
MDRNASAKLMVATLAARPEFARQLSLEGPAVWEI